MDSVAMPLALRVVWPALLAGLVAAGFAGMRLQAADWDPVSLAEVGGRYSDLRADDEEGYDGQFVYYVALNPDPTSVGPRLDVPAYRYQRILYPILARVLALGKEPWIPWTLLLVNLACLVLGTWAVAQLIRDGGSRPGYALTYGLWVGLVAAVGLDLHEPLAYGLVAWGMLAWHRGREGTAAAFLGLSLFAKETTLAFWFAALVASLATRWKSLTTAVLGGGGVLFLGWQIWLWTVFGQPGLGSGGAMATAFEWVPFMGLWRIGGVEPKALLLFSVIFGPSIVLPTLWSLFASARVVLKSAFASLHGLSLLLNATLIIFLPFSTFREPLGLVRVATGLVLALLVFASREGRRRVLNYALFWIALLSLILRS